MYDAIIVGGGPAGLSGALLLARCCRKVLLVDAGEPRNLQARHVHGLLGSDGRNPLALISQGRMELARYGVECLSDRVTSVVSLAGKTSASAAAFQIQTERGRSESGRKLILATGIRDCLPAIPGFRECYGQSVHHCPYCDGWEYRGRPLAAWSANAHEAAGLALLLRNWTRQVTAISPDANARADDRARLANAGIRLLNSEIAALRHELGQLRAIEFSASAQSIDADALFCELPIRAECEIAEALGCKLDDDRRVEVGSKQTTSVPGLFLAGDVASRVHLIAIAAAQGAQAALAAARELQDEDEARGWPNSEVLQEESTFAI